MASATRNVRSTKAAPSADDFPTLGSGNVPRTNVWGSNTGKRFSDLASTWAQQQKEEEEKQKNLTREKMTEAAKQREKEEKERAFYRVGLVNTSRLIYQSNTEEACFDLGGDKVSLSDEDEVLYEEEDEEVPDSYELDAGWNQRRSKNDLY